jgi:hypothetical protein
VTTEDIQGKECDRTTAPCRLEANGGGRKRLGQGQRRAIRRGTGWLLVLEAAAGPADAFAVDGVAAFVDPVGPDGLRVREFPDVRA